MKILKYLMLLFLMISNLYSFNYYVKKFDNCKNKKCKNVYLISGIHGDEKSGYLTLYYLSKKMKIQTNKYNIYLIPFTNIKGIIKNKRSIGHDFNNLFSKYFTKKKKESFQYFINHFFSKNKPYIVLSLHSGYSFTYGNKIVLDIKKYKNINLFKFVYPLYKNLRKNVKINLFISNTPKNRYLHNQDNFKDFSWYTLTNYNSYFYTIESTKNRNMFDQIKFHITVIKNFLDKLYIKNNLNKLVKLKNIKKFFNSKKKNFISLFFLKSFYKNKNNCILNYYNLPVIIYRKKFYYYSFLKKKFIQY